MALKVALVGLGWWGRKMVSVLRGAAEEIEIVLAVEPSLESVADFARRHNLTVVADYAVALRNADVQAVILATPHSLHEDQIAHAVAAGKHVFCEKPLALTKEGAQKSVKLCNDAGLVLGMGHERRFEPAIKELFELVDSGQLGRIQQIEANFSHDKFVSLDRDNWRLKADQSPAGGMTATGIHLLDLSVRLMGKGESVLCHCENLSSDLPQGDTVAAYIKFENGGTSYVSASLANPFISRFAVYGSMGWVEIRDKAHVEAPDGWIVTKGMADAPISVEEVPAAEAVRNNLVAFARAVTKGEPYQIESEHLVDCIALLEAITRSAISGKLEKVA